MNILVGLAIGFLLLLGVIVSLPFLIDLNEYQDQYKPLIEQALNRKVELQDIRLTIWPRLGVRVGGLTILDDPSFSAGPFASLTSLDVGVKLLPLLSKKVEIEEITLRDPVITVITNKAGVMNVSTIGAATSALPPTPSSPSSPSTTEPEPGSLPSPGEPSPLPAPGDPLQLLALFAVERVSIDGGRLTYRDLSTAPVTEYQVQDLELLLKSVLLGESPSIHLKATVLPYNLPIALDGQLGPLVERLDIKQYDLALGLGNIALALKGALVDGMLTVTLSSPAINTGDLPVALPLHKPVLIKDLLISAKAPYPLKQGASPLELADISNLSLALVMGQSSINIRGTVLNGQANVNLTSPSVNSADLPVALPLPKPVEIKDLTVTAKTRMPFNPSAPPLEIADVSDLRLAVAMGQSLLNIKGTVLGGRAQMTVSSPSIHSADLPVALPLAKPVQIKDMMVTAKTRMPFNPSAPPLEIADVSDFRLAVAMGQSLLNIKGTVLGGQAQMTVSSPSIHSADLPVALPLAKPVQIKDMMVTAKTRMPFNPSAPPLEIADVSDFRLAVAMGQSLLNIKGTVLGGRAQMTVSSPSIHSADLPVALPLAKPVQIKDMMVTAKTRMPFNPSAPPLEIADVSDLRLGLVLGQSLVTVKGSVLGGRAQMTVSSPSVHTADLPVETGLANSVELKHLIVNADLKGQDARLSNVSFQLFNGQVKAEGGLVTGSPAPPFRGTVKVDGLQLGPALAAVSPDSKVSMSGTAAMDLAVAGRGFSLPELTQALEGPGHLRIKNGKIEGINLMEETVTLLKLVGVSPDRVKTTVFSTIETDVMIKQGLVNVQRLLMDSHDFQAMGAGTVAFDQGLNLAVNLNLSQALSQRLAGSSPITKIALKEGRLKLPLFITGTVQQPSYQLDTKALTGNLQEQAQEKAKEAIKGLLDGTTRPKELEQQGKDLLKGLLRR